MHVTCIADSTKSDYGTSILLTHIKGSADKVVERKVVHENMTAIDFSSEIEVYLGNKSLFCIV